MVTYGYKGCQPVTPAVEATHQTSVGYRFGYLCVMTILAGV